jgi:hypothetical protein
MHQFTAEEFRLLLDDLLLYCGDGNVREITDTYGPTPHGGGYCGGVIHTGMDSFKFMTAGFHDQKECWAIDLPIPAECMTLGHRRIRPFYFPKLHLDPDLSARYRIANIIHYSYIHFSNMDESRRRRDLELELGYAGLKSYGRVVAQIEKDFRSYKPTDIRGFEHGVKNN